MTLVSFFSIYSLVTNIHEGFWKTVLVLQQKSELKLSLYGLHDWPTKLNCAVGCELTQVLKYFEGLIYASGGH